MIKSRLVECETVQIFIVWEASLMCVNLLFSLGRYCPILIQLCNKNCQCIFFPNNQLLFFNCIIFCLFSFIVHKNKHAIVVGHNENGKQVTRENETQFLFCYHKEWIESRAVAKNCLSHCVFASINNYNDSVEIKWKKNF